MFTLLVLYWQNILDRGLKIYMIDPGRIDHVINGGYRGVADDIRESTKSHMREQLHETLHSVELQ